MLLELKEPIYVTSPIGKGYAIVLETNTEDYFWTVILDNGAFVTFPQNQIRACRSYTKGRGISHQEMKKIINAHFKK